MNELIHYTGGQSGKPTICGNVRPSLEAAITSDATAVTCIACRKKMLPTTQFGTDPDLSNEIIKARVEKRLRSLTTLVGETATDYFARRTPIAPKLAPKDNRVRIKRVHFAGFSCIDKDKYTSEVKQFVTCSNCLARIKREELLARKPKAIKTYSTTVHWSKSNCRIQGEPGGYGSRTDNTDDVNCLGCLRMMRKEGINLTQTQTPGTLVKPVF